MTYARRAPFHCTSLLPAAANIASDVLNTLLSHQCMDTHRMARSLINADFQRNDDYDADNCRRYSLSALLLLSCCYSWLVSCYWWSSIPLHRECTVRVAIAPSLLLQLQRWSDEWWLSSSSSMARRGDRRLKAEKEKREESPPHSAHSFLNCCCQLATHDGCNTIDL